MTVTIQSVAIRLEDYFLPARVQGEHLRISWINFNADEYLCSFQLVPQHQSLDSTSSSNSTLGTDTLHLYTHFFEENGASDTSVPGLPITVLDSPPSSATINSSEPPLSSIFSTVGLGPTSTLLQALYSQGKISSRSFGLYLGQAQLPLPSSENIAEVAWSVNGSLTLGGYDSARFADPVTSFPLQEPSDGPTTLKVQINSLNLSIDNNQNKGPADLLPSNLTSGASSGIPAYISASSAPLVLPPAVLSNVESSISGLPSTTSLKLSLSLSSSSGPAIYTIPFTPADLTNLIKPSASDSAPSLLGLPFLSATYLIVSYDSATFYLAPVIPSAPYIIPQTVCPKATPTRYVPPSGHGFSKQGLVGAILGGIIAGIAITGVAICSARSWRRRRAEKQVRFRLGEEEVLGEEMKEHRLRFWRRDRN